MEKPDKRYQKSLGALTIKELLFSACKVQINRGAAVSGQSNSLKCANFAD